MIENFVMQFNFVYSVRLRERLICLGECAAQLSVVLPLCFFNSPAVCFRVFNVSLTYEICCG